MTHFVFARAAAVLLSTPVGHLYAILLEFWRDDDQPFGGCVECEPTARNLVILTGRERGLLNAPTAVGRQIGSTIF